jgi:CBS domain containing-hemolysin-like protein
VDQPDGSPLAIMGGAAHAAEMTVGEIMVPRTEIVAFPVDTPVGELLEKMLAERYTRVPIYGSSIDRVLGVLHLKELVSVARSGGPNLRDILKPALTVPTRKPILPLLSDMQRGFVHMAIVKDEFGVTQGLVTQEDILEEIVGEIRDEFDQEELSAIKPLEDGGYEAYGRVKVLDFNRRTSWTVPAEPGDTLSGLVFHSLGHAPRSGQSVSAGDYVIEVTDVSGTRITRVQVYRGETSAEAADEAGSS